MSQNNKHIIQHQSATLQEMPEINWWLETAVPRNRNLFVKVKYVKQVNEPVKIYSSTGKLTLYFKCLAYPLVETGSIFYMLKVDYEASKSSGDFQLME